MCIYRGIRIFPLCECPFKVELSLCVYENGCITCHSVDPAGIRCRNILTFFNASTDSTSNQCRNFNFYVKSTSIFQRFLFGLKKTSTKVLKNRPRYSIRCRIDVEISTCPLQYTSGATWINVNL